MIHTLMSALGISEAKARKWAPHIEAACKVAQINTPLRLAHFLGQVGHESGRLRYVREIWGPTKQQLRYDGTTLAARLGNVRAGDGKRYMGRGLIQVTGRANYAAFTERAKKLDENAPDFVTAPALLEDPRWAALSAADYWVTRKLNRYADRNDILTLTKRINGGTNGLADRQRITAAVLCLKSSEQ